MLSEIAIYYDDEVDNIPIRPFVVAPVFQQQDSLIFAPQSIACVHDEFIHKIYSSVPNTNLPFIYSRAFNYESYITIIIVFPTGVKEHNSGRTGLALTFGALFEKRLFAEYNKPASQFFRLFLSQFNKIFKIDLFDCGANQILGSLSGENIPIDLKDKFSLLHDYLLSALLLMPKKKNFLFTPLRFPFRRKHTMFPELILHTSEMNVEDLIYIFLSEVDGFLFTLNISKIDVATQSFVNETSSLFVKLDCLPNDVHNVKFKVLKNNRYLSIH